MDLISRLLLPGVVLMVAAVITGCVTVAETKRPEDVVGLRASKTEASAIASLFTGSTDVCQITALRPPCTSPDGCPDPATGSTLIDKYAIILDKDGCTIMPQSLMPVVSNE